MRKPLQMTSKPINSIKLVLHFLKLGKSRKLNLMHMNKKIQNLENHEYIKTQLAWKHLIDFWF